MSYYEHDIKVRAMDNILSRSRDWAWFIDYTEEHFSPNIEVTAFEDALLAFKEIQPVFDFLCRIHDYLDEELPISASWLKELEQLSYFCNGQKASETLVLETTFSKIMRILVYAGRIYGQIKNQKYYLYSSIFKYKNIHTLENIDLFVDEESTFDMLFNSVDINIDNEIQIFKDNINKKIIPVNEAFLSKHKTDFLSANSFSFNRIKDETITTWEEQEILNMLLTSYSDGKLIPQWSSGSYTYPDMSVWTEDILEYLIRYFNDESVTFIVESIRFAVFDIQPSQKTINLHFSLLDELYQSITEKDSFDFHCSSFEFILSFFDRKYNQKKLYNADAYKAWSNALNQLDGFERFEILFEVKDHLAIGDKSLSQKLNEFLISKAQSIENITQEHEFREYIKNKRISNLIDNSMFSNVAEKFNLIVADEKVRDVAGLFICYFKFLLRIKNNKNINSREISSEILRIRTLWQTEYYGNAVNSLGHFQSGPFSIPTEVVDNYVYSILCNPFNLALSACKLDEDMLISCMSDISEHALLTLVSRVRITEDFPYEEKLKIDDKHPVDIQYLNEVKKAIEQKGYKLLNSLKPYEYVNGLYQRITSEIQIRIHLLNNVEPLYSAVVDQNSEYQFIEYSNEPLLAHITQLFPILENKIRFLGEMLNIVPVCEKEELSHRLKEPHSIINIILDEVSTLTGSISGAADLFFIHFCMFGENGLNIRNDCIHGNGYQNKEQLSFAFKVTLICLYLVGCRCQSIIENMEDSPNEVETVV